MAKGKLALTDDVSDKICAHIAGGGSLRSLLAKDKSLPVKSTVLLWVVKGEAGDKKYSTFSAQYLLAQEASGHAHADEIVHLSERAMEEGANPHAVRTAMNGLMWAAERMHSKRYAMKAQGTGKNGAFVVELSQADAKLF